MPALQYGIGLHVGDVTYGNIGIPKRLQFTVIGSAANEASRIESMTKELGESVHMPRIGCGLAGGEWSQIEPIIEEHLSKEGVAVTVYDFE